MTAPKSTLRTRRRVARADHVPIALRRWFDGTDQSPPWEALLPGDAELLPERWAAWKALHPDARPPADFEWLDEISTKGATP